MASIRFDETTDAHLIRRIEAEQTRREDTTLTKTARSLLAERLEQVESRREATADAAPPAAPASPED